MTDAELQAIQERCDAASKGPWYVEYHDDHNIRSDAAEYVEIADVFGDEEREFVAHARSDVPALVAEVRRLQHLLVFVYRRLCEANLPPDFPTIQEEEATWKQINEIDDRF